MKPPRSRRHTARCRTACHFPAHRGAARATALLVAGALALLAALPSAAGAFPPERRRNYEARAPNEYLIIPALASIPGAGVFAGVLASASNLGGTGVDVGGAVAQSIDGTDIRIRAVALQNVPLYRPAFVLDYQVADIKLGNFQAYIPGRDSPNFTVPITAEFRFQMLRPRLVLWERRIQLSYTLGFFDGFDFDERGNEIPFAQHSARADMRLDFTDDVLDPRRGVRFGYGTTLDAPQHSILGDDSGRSSAFGNESSVRVEEYLLNGYIPLAEHWVLAWSNRYFAATGREDGDEVVSGGSPPLRGYPGGRWSDRYGVFSGAEARYTIPLFRRLDFALARGILEGIQLAAFYEVGQVSPTRDHSLFEAMHHSYGGGVRALFSGVVVRLDLAGSDEGVQTHLTIDQPF